MTFILTERLKHSLSTVLTVTGPNPSTTYTFVKAKRRCQETHLTKAIITTGTTTENTGGGGNNNTTCGTENLFRELLAKLLIPI